MLSYFDSFERRVYFICRILSLLNVHNLSQENVSCLNTALIILMLAYKRHTLPGYLQAIAVKSFEGTTTSFTSAVAVTNQMQQQQSTTHTTHLLENLKSLLVFWKAHYLQKDKDWSALEQSSHIEFTEWIHTVDLLLGTDKQNECSIEYYLMS